MRVHERYGLTPVINARGTYTPLGVSRSPEEVRRAVDQALSDFFDMDELHTKASRLISDMTGATAGTVVHCVSAAITLSVAATMTGLDLEKIQALPDSGDMPNRVVLAAGHAIDYGHPIVQDIRLAGAHPVLAGNDESCTIEQLSDELAQANVACLLLVSSRLTRGKTPPLGDAVAVAHRHGRPAIIDGAAQDMRMAELLGTGADLVLISAQKYLAAPTAGLVLGQSDLVGAVHAQQKGIGRAMKASKEGILGLLAAMAERQHFDRQEWQVEQEQKVAAFVAEANRLPGIQASAVPDKAGMPFTRAWLSIDSESTGHNADSVEQQLKDGQPSIRVMRGDGDDSMLCLELVPLEQEEIAVILSRLAEILDS